MCKSELYHGLPEKTVMFYNSFAFGKLKKKSSRCIFKEKRKTRREKYLSSEEDTACLSYSIGWSKPPLCANRIPLIWFNGLCFMHFTFRFVCHRHSIKYAFFEKLFGFIRSLERVSTSQHWIIVSLFFGHNVEWQYFVTVITS